MFNGLRFRVNRFKSITLTNVVGEKENYDFGHASVFQEYAYVSQNKSLQGRYQHGWMAFPEIDFWKNNFARTYVWNDEMLLFAKNRNWSNFYSIGSSWLYFLEIMKRNGFFDVPGIDKKLYEELWVYGNHSTSACENELFEMEDFVAKAINSKVVNKAILLFYLDYEIVMRRFPNLREQIQVLTLGPRRDSFFANSHFTNLFWILRHSKVLVTEYPTSMVCYAISLGVDIEWFKNDSFNEAFEKAKANQQQDLQFLMSGDFARSEDFIDYVHGIMGKKIMKSPEEIRAYFKWNSGPRDNLCRIFTILQSILYSFRGLNYTPQKKI